VGRGLSEPCGTHLDALSCDRVRRFLERMPGRAFVICLAISLFLLFYAGTVAGAARLEDLGNGTVRDRDTGLMWYKDAMPAETGMPLEMALGFINTLNREKSLGYSDWRLPRLEELLSLVGEGSQYPALHQGHPFYNVRPDFYWTSSTGFNLAGYAWAVDMGTGAVTRAEASYCNFYYLWPVRTHDEGAWRFPSRAAEQRVLDKARVLPTYLDLLAGEAGKQALENPRAPIGASASAVTKDEIALSWKPSGEDRQVWYNVYSEGSHIRSTEGTSVRVKGLKPNTKKCFIITARAGSGPESEPSREVCATTWKGDLKKGTVWAMGLNSFGQMGDGTRVDAALPVLVEGLEDVIEIAAGVEHALAVRKDGTVWAWGRNTRGQLGDGTTKGALSPRRIKGLDGIVAVAAGWYHSMALDSGGNVWAWGRNYYGQLGDGTRTDRLKPVRVKGLGSIRSISAGWYHSLALTSKGKVYVWGWNRHGQLADADMQDSVKPIRVHGLPDVKDIAAGMEHSVALSLDGSALAWGRNDFGQLGVGNQERNSYPVKVKGLAGAVYIECSMHYCLALLKGGKLAGWGKNEYGQLGSAPGSVVNEAVPVELQGSVRLLAAGAHQAAAVMKDGTLWAWGWDYAGDTRNAPPAEVGGITGYDRIASGVHFMILLKGK